MIDYPALYQQATQQPAPAEAARLNPLFAAIANDDPLPPRGQQAVDAGFTAHTLVNATENPAIYRYYQWVLATCLAEHPVHELTAQLVGTAFVSANVFDTDMPQPVTVNPWQVTGMLDFPLNTDQAVILENNGVFIWLHQRHPDWPLINQSGNALNETYKTLLRRLVQRGVRITYLGDLDSEGLRIADRVQGVLPMVAPKDLFALQLPQQVFAWLVQDGKVAVKRTQHLPVETALLKEEMASLHTVGRFVEQEQLIGPYELAIGQWLGTKTL